jgi:hypothetical protein
MVVEVVTKVVMVQQCGEVLIVATMATTMTWWQHLWNSCGSGIENV